MKNKQISQIWFGIIGLAFCWGFYCAAVDRPTQGAVMGLLQLSSIIFSIWGMVRLWKSDSKASE